MIGVQPIWDGNSSSMVYALRCTDCGREETTIRITSLRNHSLLHAIQEAAEINTLNQECHCKAQEAL